MFACSRTIANTVSLIDSAINIKTSGGIESGIEIVVCHACAEPPCAAACPTGALTPKTEGGVTFNKELCDGCAQCVDACLVGAIHLGYDNKAVVCKYCGNCARFCPHNVLELMKLEVI
jgi:Fe-S-cluster-containing dehydrogenase component